MCIRDSSCIASTIFFFEFSKTWSRSWFQTNLTLGLKNCLKGVLTSLSWALCATWFIRSNQLRTSVIVLGVGNPLDSVYVLWQWFNSGQHNSKSSKLDCWLRKLENPCTSTHLYELNHPLPMLFQVGNRVMQQAVVNDSFIALHVGCDIVKSSIVTVTTWQITLWGVFVSEQTPWSCVNVQGLC